jgi:hypothetical protein
MFLQAYTTVQALKYFTVNRLTPDPRYPTRLSRYVDLIFIIPRCAFPGSGRIFVEKVSEFYHNQPTIMVK